MTLTKSWLNIGFADGGPGCSVEIVSSACGGNVVGFIITNEDEKFVDSIAPKLVVRVVPTFVDTAVAAFDERENPLGNVPDVDME